MPLNALILVAICVALLALINIGSTAAFNAFISLTALALYVSYILPILFLLWRRISRPKSIVWGPFRLGKYGVPLNLLALCYVLFLVAWMPLPTILPVDANNMNYAGPLFAAVILGALLDWVISGRKRFEVPYLGRGTKFEF